MSNKAILPCPHCGGRSCLYSNYSGRYRKYFVYVKCEVCGSQGKTYTTNDDPATTEWCDDVCDNAVGAWNMRFKVNPE